MTARSTSAATGSKGKGNPVAGKAKGKPEQPKRPRGRQTIRTSEITAEIVERLSKGEPMAVICRDEGMPAYRTVKDWMDADSAFAADIARAREEGFDWIATETLEIADDSRNDWMERSAKEGDEKALQFNGEHVQRAKLRIETRLKLLAKWDPKRYGDKVQTEISGPDGGPVQCRTLTDSELSARIAELEAKFRGDRK